MRVEGFGRSVFQSRVNLQESFKPFRLHLVVILQNTFHPDAESTTQFRRNKKKTIYLLCKQILLLFFFLDRHFIILDLIN